MRENNQESTSKLYDDKHVITYRKWLQAVYCDTLECMTIMMLGHWLHHVSLVVCWDTPLL